MSKIERKDVEDVAKLSRLALTDQQVDTYTQQLDQILGYIDKLNDLDVEGVSPMVHANELLNVLREDEPDLPIDRTLALKNAPHVESVTDAQDASTGDLKGQFFTVPKVLGQGSS